MVKIIPCVNFPLHPYQNVARLTSQKPQKLWMHECVHQLCQMHSSSPSQTVQPIQTYQTECCFPKMVGFPRSTPCCHCQQKFYCLERDVGNNIYFLETQILSICYFERHLKNVIRHINRSWKNSNVLVIIFSSRRH